MPQLKFDPGWETLLADAAVTLIDCRSADEDAALHVEGSRMVSCPMGQDPAPILADAVSRGVIPDAKDAPILVFWCVHARPRAHVRALARPRACMTTRHNAYTKAYNTINTHTHKNSAVGGRSQRAKEALVGMGYTGVMNAGGAEAVVEAMG